MKVTKQGHACLIFEEQGKQLVLDPGSYSEPQDNLSDVVAIVITHIHDDHCFIEQIDRILKTNPEAMIYCPPDAAEKLANYKTTVVYHGDYISDGLFTVEFFGDLHAEIHRSYPLVQNRGVLVNDKLYYPGDSFTLPDRKVEMLAVPTSAPWLKIGEVMDFVDAIDHKQSMPTHNALLSDFGHNLNNGRVKAITESKGGTFTYLLNGESIEI
ncbi:MAG: MBL fold metallo-hydrolase [Micrococcales bacterium]|nr:MBL fold metallo-hydrolase [Micrococcales bacterium]NBY43239.1 MBL fold metallo-hydrolase [Micrococcales bacterium]